MIDIERLEQAYAVAERNLLAERNSTGHWTGQLSTSALSTATAISALSAVQQAEEHQQYQEMIEAGVGWLANHQNSDGGWGDTGKSYSNISTTLLAIAAFHFADQQDALAQQIELAQAYVESQGGIPGLRRRYGKDKTFAVPILANCAMAGTQPWKEVSALPFEAACVPQKIYHWMQLPVVSYAIPALVAIGQAKYFHDPPWNPISRTLRWLSVQRSLNVLKRMQPASGGFLEAIPLTSFVVMGLATTGRAQHPVVQNGIRFIRESVLSDGSWPIDTNLATWTTTLSVNALSAKLSSSSSSSDAEENAPAPTLPGDECLDWILGCQNQTVHPFTNSPPGGWGWTDLSGAVPDADDTPGALLALSNYLKHSPDLQHSPDASDRTARILKAAQMGIEWLLKLQNRDNGWPTFCRGWGKLPFDRSGSDITAHCLRAIHAWRDRVEIPKSKIDRALDRGMQYLQRNQLDDGSWLPLWFGNQDHPQEENPVYGTSKVLAAFSELGFGETSSFQRGLKWLALNQNPDGSWGGGPSAAERFAPFDLRKRTNRSHPAHQRHDGSDAGSDARIGTIEESALALEALLFSKDLTSIRDQLTLGVDWLVDAVEADCYRIDWPIGFYFAKLWYHERLYPQIFTVSALGRVLARIREIRG